jgi:hypothetical protein
LMANDVRWKHRFSDAKLFVLKKWVKKKPFRYVWWNNLLYLKNSFIILLKHIACSEFLLNKVVTDENVKKWLIFVS